MSGWPPPLDGNKAAAANSGDCQFGSKTSLFLAKRNISVGVFKYGLLQDKRIPRTVASGCNLPDHPMT
jgi:hypothetical protein